MEINTGSRLGRLEIIWLPKPYISKWKNKWSIYLCKCDCWNIKSIMRSSLIRWTLSCWCLARELLWNRARTHGMTDTVEFNTWCSIRQRCFSSKWRDYKNYQKRWITMSDDWKNSFDAFFRDMWKRPSKKHSIDRIDNNWDYCKENCKWSTHMEQVNNRQSTKMIEYKWMRKSIADWERYFWFRKCSLQQRLKKWMSFEEAVTKPFTKI